MCLSALWLKRSRLQKAEGRWSRGARATCWKGGGRGGEERDHRTGGLRATHFGRLGPPESSATWVPSRTSPGGPCAGEGPREGLG